MSYTKFEYDGLQVEEVNAENETVKVRVEVSNTGKFAGEEVVQLYVGFSNSEIDRPVKLLKGFDKIDLKQGEVKTVEFEIDFEDLAWYDVESDSWQIEKMNYEVFVGPSSDSAQLLADSFSIE